MPALKAEGEFSGKVIEASIVDSNFKEDDEYAMQAMVKMETSDGQSAIWYGSISSKIIQNGGNAGKSWVEITKQTLDHLGVKDLQLTKMDSCIGKEVSWVMKEKEGRYSVSYIVTGHKKLDDKEVESRLAKILTEAEIKSEPSTGSVDNAPAGDEGNIDFLN